MKIVAFLGSPRIKGNTSYLTDVALEEAAKLGIETEKIIVTKYQINPCLGHDNCQDFTSCPQKDDAESVLNKLFEADGVILASPVYFNNVTAQLKALIDRSRIYRRHKRKLTARCAGFIITALGGGVEETASALNSFIKLAARIAPEKIWRASGFAGNEGEVKGNAAVVEEARNLGRKMAGELLASK